mmetsp:Transcript_69193/g.195337  ORF Transcript_69193/g.195337 Transcript_69193/m.195337 type:complete len:448 (-) Transcript_69193:62-1405(-)
MVEQRQRLGGFYPTRQPAKVSSIIEIPETGTYTLFDKGNPKPMSTTMAFASLLRKLMKMGDFGKRCVPMVTDEARTFGMNAFFHEFKIHAPFGQHYTPVDHDILMKYSEAPDGQILQEGISEAGALCTWIACGTSYASQGCPMLPFFIYYSMFGFQRVGDFIWQAADARSRGFLLGATAGRTTLNGEGLQHQDGHSNLFAISNPACIAWDPAFSYELAYIIEDGIYKMWGQDKDLIYYISLYNENHPMPEVPKHTTCGVSTKEAVLKGLYKFQEAPADKALSVRVISSGSIMQQALRAVDLLAEFGVGVEIWSATNIGELNREAFKAERYSRLHPMEPKKSCWVNDCLGDYDGVTVISSDNISQYHQLIEKYCGGDVVNLGTDGFGRSDTREKLRRFFEIDSESICVGALSALARQGKVDPKVAQEAIEKFGLKYERQDITMDNDWP